LWGELADALRNQLKLRPNRVVNVEADEHVPWADVVNVMDHRSGDKCESYSPYNKNNRGFTTLGALSGTNRDCCCYQAISLIENLPFFI
jgi:hypothetical protein